MSQYFWLLPSAASIFLIVALIYLGVKSKGLNRQLEKFNRRKSKFIETLPKVRPFESSSALPSLPAAKTNRRIVVEARTKKHAAKQRRLVEHLKDLQAKESE